jgi:hypothetical protein
MSGYFWVVLGFLVVFITKYLTSVRLRGLTDRMQREQADAQELRHVLVQVEEKETQLKTETDRLQAKVSWLAKCRRQSRAVLAALPRFLIRGSGNKRIRPALLKARRAVFVLLHRSLLDVPALQDVVSNFPPKQRLQSALGGNANVGMRIVVRQCRQQ